MSTFIDKLLMTRGVQFVLDLGEVRDLSSAALSQFIKLKQRVPGATGKLRIEDLHPDPLEVFQITRLDEVFDPGR